MSSIASRLAALEARRSSLPRYEAGTGKPRPWLPSRDFIKAPSAAQRAVLSRALAAGRVGLAPFAPGLTVAYLAAEGLFALAAWLAARVPRIARDLGSAGFWIPPNFSGDGWTDVTDVPPYTDSVYVPGNPYAGLGSHWYVAGIGNVWAPEFVQPMPIPWEVGAAAPGEPFCIVHPESAAWVTPDGVVPDDWATTGRIWIYEAGQNDLEFTGPLEIGAPAPGARSSKSPSPQFARMRDRRLARRRVGWPLSREASYQPPGDPPDQPAEAPSPFGPPRIPRGPNNQNIEGEARSDREEPRRKERKINIGARGVVLGGIRFSLEALLEAGDAIQAVFQALPREIKDRVRTRAFERGIQEWIDANDGTRFRGAGPSVSDMLEAIYEHAHLLDAEGVVRELAWESLQDYAYGRLGQLGMAALKRLGMSNPTTISPGTGVDGDFSAPHVLDPQIPTGVNADGSHQPLRFVQEAITGRRAREERQSRTDYAQEVRRQERQRWRDETAARVARSRAYRAAMSRVGH